jgi:hypothetical protein
VATVIASAILALLAAACGGGSPSGSGGGSGSPAGSASSPSVGGSAHLKIVAFSHCMRSHGVPRYPDPSAGQIDVKVDPRIQGPNFGVSNSQFQAAWRACRPVLPVGANDQFPAAMMPQILREMRNFSHCMRAHGVPDWPDPIVNSEGQPGFNASPGQQATATVPKCQHLEPSQLHGGVPLVNPTTG